MSFKIGRSLSRKSAHFSQQLRHDEVVEKNILPTSGDIAREKVPTVIMNFDAEKLKHIEPIIKLALPSADDVIRDEKNSKLK